MGLPRRFLNPDPIFQGEEKQGLQKSPSQEEGKTTMTKWDAGVTLDPNVVWWLGREGEEGGGGGGGW